MFAVITYYHPHEGHAVINEVLSPFNSIDEAFAYITGTFELHNIDNLRACQNYDFQLSTKSEIYLRDRIGHVCIQPVRNPNEDAIVKRLDGLIEVVTALADFSEEVKQHASAMRIAEIEQRSFKAAEMMRMLASLALKLEPLRNHLRDEFEQLKKETGK